MANHASRRGSGIGHHDITIGQPQISGRQAVAQRHINRVRPVIGISHLERIIDAQLMSVSVIKGVMRIVTDLAG